MSVEQIAARLDDRFRLLNRGDRTALPRQQTLRALIDWSHDLLDGKERTVFRRLAVFAGGWTLEAAEAVGAGGDIARTDVLDLLSSLVEKSLVMIDVSGRRYRMLDTVRQYALERLRESSEWATTRERHLGFFLSLVESALPHLLGGDQGSWMVRLDLENENILAAHDWCSESPVGAEAGIRLVGALKYYWLSRGLLGQGYGKASEVIALPAPSPVLRARALVDAGTIATFIGRYTEARKHLEQGLAISRGLGDDILELTVRQYLAEVEFSTGNRERALSHCVEAEVLARRAGNQRTLAAVLNAKGQLLRVLGKLDEAESLYGEALLLFRGLRDDENIAVVLLNLAIVAVLRRRPATACVLLGEVIAVQSRIDSQAAGQSLLEVCAGLAAELGDWSAGARFAGAAEAQAARTGLRRDPADQAFILSVVDRIRGQAGESAAAQEAGGSRWTYDEALLSATRWLARTRADV
jgi:tetratricopeptide (TPR) repeat protein